MKNGERELSVAIEIAREAGALLKLNFGKVQEVDFKGRINLVTEMDRKSERLIVERKLPEAAAVLTDAAELVDDHEGSVDYKRHLIGVFLRRAFAKALGEAG